MVIISIKSLGWGGGCDLVMEGLLQINNLLKGLCLPFLKERVCGGAKTTQGKCIKHSDKGAW